MKPSSTDRVDDGLGVPPPLTRERFGSALPSVQRYGHWLATAGVERGLIGPREVARLWPRHLLNCTALVEFLPRQGLVVDIGSGAGLPGIVLALLRPDLEVVLLEPLLRRSDFLTEVVADLTLPRVQVVRARAQEYARDHAGSAQAVTARAVAPLDRLAGWSAPLLAPGGRLLALKGQSAADEVASAGEMLAASGLSAATAHPVTIGDSVTFVVCARRSSAALVRSGANALTRSPRRSGTRRKRR